MRYTGWRIVLLERVIVGMRVWIGGGGGGYGRIRHYSNERYSISGIGLLDITFLGTSSAVPTPSRGVTSMILVMHVGWDVVCNE